LKNIFKKVWKNGIKIVFFAAAFGRGRDPGMRQHRIGIK
jgi:hypothetical protein